MEFTGKEVPARKPEGEPAGGFGVRAARKAPAEAEGAAGQRGFGFSKRLRYCPYPSSESFSAGMKRRAAEFMQ